MLSPASPHLSHPIPAWWHLAFLILTLSHLTLSSLPQPISYTSPNPHSHMKTQVWLPYASITSPNIVSPWLHSKRNCLPYIMILSTPYLISPCSHNHSLSFEPHLPASLDPTFLIIHLPHHLEQLFYLSIPSPLSYLTLRSLTQPSTCRTTDLHVHLYTASHIPELPSLFHITCPVILQSLPATKTLPGCSSFQCSPWMNVSLQHLFSVYTLLTLPRILSIISVCITFIINA